MRNMSEKKYVLIFILSVFVCVTTLIGGSYALIQRVLTGTNTYSMKTGNFLVEFLDSPEITLSNQLPAYDNVGMNNGNEMSFSVTNSGNYIASYSVKIEETSSESMKEIIRYAVDYGNGYSYENVHALSNNQYIVQNKSLGVEGTDSYKLRFWLDIDATEEYINKVFSAKVVVESTQKEYKYAPNILDSVYAQDNQEGLTAVDTNGSLYTNGEIREYRYSGNDVNNYVWFNCDTGYTSGSSHCEKWRIIGSFDNTYENGVGKYRVLKIVRDEAISSEKYNTNTGNAANFDTSSIKKYLNETYYNSLSNDAKDLIMKANWHTASVLNKVSIKESYYIEQNNQSYNYVGLVNTSDYGYASENTIWETTIKDANITSSNNWLHQENSMLLNTKNITDTVVYYVSNNKIIEGNTTTSYKVRPTVYLKPDVSIINGFGTNEEPYELAIKYEMTYGTKSDIKVSNTDVLYNVLKRNAVMDNISSEYVESENGINFSQISSNTNGRGLYMMADTKDEEYPIMYYRGNVDNNNVMFGGYCWQIVRTTETGGVKLIYNGTPGDVYEKTILKEEEYTIVSNTGNFTYDENGDYLTVLDTTGSVELSFKVPTSDNYILNFAAYVPSTGNGSSHSITLDGKSIVSRSCKAYETFSDYISVGAISNESVMKVSLNGIFSFVKIRMIKVGNLIGYGCDNIGTSAQLNASDNFHQNSNSIAYSGYMYNTVYERISASPITGAYFGNSFDYQNGAYTLINAKEGYDSSHRYTCNSTNSTTTCEKIRYYYTNNYYIELTNGKSIDDALEEMLRADDVNQIDSNIKVTLETWYKGNLIDYANDIEDAVWCNDRSYDLNDWSSNGLNELRYGAYNRAYITKDISLKCSNTIDSFSISNKDANTNYPVGLLTADEVRLAGGALYTANSTNYYLYTGAYYWLMSPVMFSNDFTRGFIVNGTGNLTVDNLVHQYRTRPSISLVPGITFVEGDGTKGNPYVIGNN